MIDRLVRTSSMVAVGALCLSALGVSASYADSPEVELFIEDSPLGQFDGEDWDVSRIARVKTDDDYFASLGETSVLDGSVASHSLFANEEIIFAEPASPLVPTPVLKAGRFTMEPMVGKITSVTPNGSDHSCTGTVVSNASGNMIVTAAHCLYNKNPDNGPDGWHTDVKFHPAYKEGPLPGGVELPFGQWSLEGASIYHGWMNDADRLYDQAFITIAPRLEESIADVVGSKGLLYETRPSVSSIHIWGYPNVGTYEGWLDPQRCAPTSFRTDDDHKSNGWLLGGVCNMTGGASGGPWLRNDLGLVHKKGYVSGVTSGRIADSPEDAGYIYASVFNENTQVLYDHRDAID